MTITFQHITPPIVQQLMPIENACHSHPWSEKLFTSCIGGHYFGQYLTIDKNIIGFYIGQHVAGEATLMDICISPDYQGNGHGKKLLQEFFNHTTTLHCEKIFLEVRASNHSAKMLYINQGFSETGRRTAYYPSAKGFGYEDAIVMNKMTNLKNK